MDMLGIELPDATIDDIYKSFDGVPFGNSDYQDAVFLMGSQLTPYRKLRAVCLRLRDRLLSLHEAYYNLKRENVDILEMQEKLAGTSLGKYERMRMEIDIEQKLSIKKDTQKLVDDALHEVNFLLTLWRALPHPTREEFETEEQEHFEKSLRRQALGVTGALESLANMGLMVGDKGELKRLPEGV